ncbi:MAG: hypothetical protein WA151_07335, partial [Desulfatirhabdiaceae bacterium]
TYSVKDMQNMRAILQSAIVAGIDIVTLESLIDAKIVSLRRVLPASQSFTASRLQPDNITTCKICGKPAIIVPIPRADLTHTATHAIQCQNRPATDQPWRDGMCGHTEYIVRGDK